MSWERTSAAQAVNGLSFSGMIVRPPLQRAEIRGKSLAFVQRPVLQQPPEHSFEVEYGKIGAWKGPHATPEERERVRQFWIAQGERGARWLCQRLRTETHVDALHGVASTLANIGEVSVAPILDELEGQPSVEQAEALLSALKSIRLPVMHPSLDRIVQALDRYLRSGDPDLVERSAAATRVLDRRRAIDLLEQATKRYSADEELSEVIREELSDRLPKS